LYAALHYADGYPQNADQSTPQAHVISHEQADEGGFVKPEPGCGAIIIDNRLRNCIGILNLRRLAAITPAFSEAGPPGPL
jgi:hypothetical protein